MAKADDQRERDPGEDREERGRGQRNGELPMRDARELVRQAMEQLAELTGHRLEGASGLARDKDGWRVTVEVVELERIPPSTDVLGSYEVELDRDGNLVGYERTRRYIRSQADEH